MEKVCAVPYRLGAAGAEVLAFRHPLAGRQFVKGTREAGERTSVGARRELFEESGILLEAEPVLLADALIGAPALRWFIHAWETNGLPDAWEHWTEDGGGHLFSFFWHPLDVDLDEEWHPIFHETFRSIRAMLPNVIGKRYA